MEEGKRYQLDITDAYKLLLEHKEKLSLGVPNIDFALKHFSCNNLVADFVQE